MARRRGCVTALAVLGVMLLLCAMAGLVSALSNRNLPVASPAVDRLSDLDKARLAEALHIQQRLGDQIWPGLSEAAIPVLLWNRETSFLVGLDDPPSDWRIVEADTFFGEPYFRQPTDNPQNFAVPVGDRLAASIATKSETDAFLIQQFQTMLPPLIRDIFPYRAMIQPSEVQISAVLHEGFHVFQSEAAPDKLERGGSS